MESGVEGDVPVLTGNNRDENGASPTLAMTVAQYQAYAETTFGDRAAEFPALYPAGTDTEAVAQYNNYARDEERVSTFLWGTQFRNTATSSYVANFVATGNPNSRSLPAWPALRTTKPLSMELGDHFTTLPAADSDAKYAFLKDCLQSQTTAY
jgi:carboxylesterase type B